MAAPEPDPRPSTDAGLHAAREESIRFAVSELGDGLSRLSNGDVTVRLQHEFDAKLDPNSLVDDSFCKAAAAKLGPYKPAP